jgi:hypothetical protein
MEVLGERLGAGGFDRGQSVGEHRGEDLDHLPVAVVGAGELAPDAVQCCRQHPILERAPLRKAPGLRARTPDDRRMSLFGSIETNCLIHSASAVSFDPVLLTCLESPHPVDDLAGRGRGIRRLVLTTFGDGRRRLSIRPARLFRRVRDLLETGKSQKCRMKSGRPGIYINRLIRGGAEALNPRSWRMRSGPARSLGNFPRLR